MAASLPALRARLDALERGELLPGSFLGRALARLGARDGTPGLPKLEALDRELDAVGIHTSMDARLLASLGVQEGRAGALAKGLLARAAEVTEEFEAAVALLERKRVAGEPPAQHRAALEAVAHRFGAVARAVRVAELFATAGPEPEVTLLPRPARQPGPPPASARVAIAEFWAERAQGNAVDLVQRRRDLDAAHELLLAVGEGQERDRVRRLRAKVAGARERVRQEPAVRSLLELTRALRPGGKAAPEEAYARLRGLYERAVEAQDGPLASAAARALEPLLARGAAEVRAAVERSEGLRRAQWLGPRREDELSSRLMDLALGADPAMHEFFELAAGAEHYFDVEDALAQEVVEREAGRPRPRLRRVPYPTQAMTYEHTGGLHEVHNFVLSDPRRLIYDLASNRQQVRAYLEEVQAPAPRRVRKSAVRVYVCDASGSMYGRRARMRNALLIAELNNLRRRALLGEPFDPLYFSFFNDRATELVRVDAAEEAARRMTELLSGGPAEGQTDISLALISAFESIRAAQGKDPHLARATVVLITDGEDRVDLPKVRQARAVGALEVALSFISLGEENRDLRALALEQRQRGTRAFYHHLSDRELGEARTEFDSAWRTLLPPSVEVTSQALQALRPNLEALEALARRAPVRPILTLETFDTLFPVPEGPPPQLPEASVEEAARCADIVAAVAEAASLAPAEGRAEEASVLLTHLLGVYGLTMPAYLRRASAAGGALREGLERVRLLCRPAGA